MPARLASHRLTPHAAARTVHMMSHCCTHSGIGHANASLLRRTIAADGTLLKPSRPITELDSVIALGSSHPKGYVLGTHTDSGAHIFVSFKVKQ